MKSLAELEAIREKTLAKVNVRKDDDSDNIRIVVGMATCGIASGARPVLKSFMDEIEKRQLKDVYVTQTGCIGMCRFEPIVEVFMPDGNKITYIHMDESKTLRVVNDHIVNGNVVSEYTIGTDTK